MSRSYLALALFPALTLAQYQPRLTLATNHTGSKVVFVTGLALTPEQAPGFSRLLMADGKSLTTLLEASRRRHCNQLPYLGFPAHIPGTENSFAVQELWPCVVARLVQPLRRSVRIDQHPWIEDNSPGGLQFSGLGNYAVIEDGFGASSLVSLENGSRTTVIPPRVPGDPARVLAGPHAISNLAQIVLLEVRNLINWQEGGSPLIWEAGELRPLGLSNATECALDPEGRYVVCSTADRLIAIDLPSKQQRILADGKFRSSRIDVSGDRLLVVSAENDARVLAMPEGTELYRLKLAGETVLSGDGRIVFTIERDLLLRNGTLKRYDLESSSVETWFEPPPVP